MTVENYARAMRQPHYPIDRDLVVEAPDGSFAAFAMAWCDPMARVGEFEPVGTHPDHRRRGLGRAVLRTGWPLLHQAGALDVHVFSESDNAASQALYAGRRLRCPRHPPPLGRPALTRAPTIEPMTTDLPARRASNATRWARWTSRPTPCTAPRRSGPS